jgi:hypothetical protein
MPKVTEVNKFFKDREKRDALIMRNVIQSSAFEGIYVTEEQIKQAQIKLDQVRRKKTA